MHYQSFISLMGSSNALSQIRHLDVGGATMVNFELSRLIVAWSSARPQYLRWLPCYAISKCR